MTKKHSRFLVRGPARAVVFACLAAFALWAPGPARSQSGDLPADVRYDVLRHKLNQAIKAKQHRDTIRIIGELRKTEEGAKGEILFYEGHAYYQLQDWPKAYKSLVAYLNALGRKGRNYKVAIGLFVETERAVKQRRHLASELTKAEKSWAVASTAYDEMAKLRDAWRERVTTFGGPKNDSAWVMARRSDGGFLVGGTFDHAEDKKAKRKAGRSMGLMALTKNGRMAWNRIVIGPAKDGAVRSLARYGEQGFVLGGSHRGFHIVTRIDQHSVPVRNHEGKPWVVPVIPTKESPRTIVVPAGKGDILAIGTKIFTKDGKSPRLPFAMRLDKSGKALGTTVYTGSTARFWHDIAGAAELKDGGVIAVGQTKPQAAWDTRPAMGYLLRLGPDAKLVWSQRVGGDTKAAVTVAAAAGTGDGGILAVGQQGTRLLLYKAAEDGSEVWRKAISYRSLMPKTAKQMCGVPDLVSRIGEAEKSKGRTPPSAERVAAVRALVCSADKPFASATAIVAGKDGYFVLGVQGTGDRKKADIRLLFVDDQGEIVWDKIYGHDGLDIATAALPTEDGGLILAGATDSVGTGGNDFLMFKVDRKGNFARWTKLGPPVTAKPKDPAPPSKAAKPEAPKTTATEETPRPPEDGEADVTTPAETVTKTAPKADRLPAKTAETERPEEPKAEDADPEDSETKKAATTPADAPDTAKSDQGGKDPQPDKKPSPAAPSKSAATEEEAPTEPKKADAEAPAPSQPKQEAAPSRPATEDSDEPPPTSFGAIFGSVFGSDDEEDSENKKKKSAPEAPDPGP